MTTYSVKPKQNEKPSILSRRVLRTFRLNEAENMKLKERLEHLGHSHMQQNALHSDDVRGLKRTMKRINSVKDKMEVSVHRRRFLAEYGVSVKQNEIDIEEFVNSLDEAIFDDKERRAKCSSNSRPLLDSRTSSASASGSSSEISVSSSLRLPIDSLLRKGKEKDKRKARASSALPLTVTNTTDVTQGNEMARELPRPKSAPISRTRQPFIFREITPPLKGRRVEEVYKQKEQEDKILQKLKEKEEFRKRASGVEPEKGYKSQRKTAFSNVLDAANKIEVRSSSFKEEHFSEKEDDITTNDLYAHSDPDTDTKTAWDDLSSDCNSNEEGHHSENDVGLDLQKLMIGSVTPKRQKSLSLLNVNDPSDKFNHNDKTFLAVETVKWAKTNEEVFTESGKHKSKVAWADMCMGIKKSNNLPEYESHTYTTDSTDDGVRAENTRDKWRNIVRKVSEDSVNGQLDKWHDIVKKVSDDLKKQQKKLESLERRPRTVRRRAKTFHAEEEIVYDARPNKSVSKGYTTMQITVGRKSVSIFVPRFKSDTVCSQQTESRANAKSSLSVEEVRTKRVEREKKS